MRRIVNISAALFSLGVATFHAIKGNLELEILFIFLTYINWKNAMEDEE